jgi:hypothetical protein
LSLATEERAEFRDWAEATIAGLSQRSPTLLKVTLEQLRRGRDMGLADCFRMELGLVNACFDQATCAKASAPASSTRTTIRAGIRRGSKTSTAPPVDAFFAPRWDPARHPLASLS